jgi:hypothetical protein
MVEQFLGVQGDFKLGRLEKRMVILQDEVVTFSAVVKPRGALHLERDTSANDASNSNDSVDVAALFRIVDRHEVDDFAHAIGGEVAGNQNRGINKVELFDDRALRSAGERKVSTSFRIEKRRKD